MSALMVLFIYIYILDYDHPQHTTGRTPENQSACVAAQSHGRAAPSSPLPRPSGSESKHWFPTLKYLVSGWLMMGIVGLMMVNSWFLDVHSPNYGNRKWLIGVEPSPF